MFFKTKNRTIHFTDSGQGEVLVLLHGFLEDLSIWDAFKGNLSQTNRVICIDLLGHGKSACEVPVHTMELMADAVLATLQFLNIGFFKICGHSMGGYVALAIAKKEPQLVTAICLMNSTPYADTPEKIVNRDRAINAVKSNVKTFIRMSVNNLFLPKQAKTYNTAITQLISKAKQMPVQGITAALEGMKVRTDSITIISKIKTEIIIGEQDPVLNATELIALAKTLQLNYHILKGGHMSFIENNDAVTVILNQFALA